jgi:hypothetical protein
MPTRRKSPERRLAHRGRFLGVESGTGWVTMRTRGAARVTATSPAPILLGLALHSRCDPWLVFDVLMISIGRHWHNFSGEKQGPGAGCRRQSKVKSLQRTP